MNHRRLHLTFKGVKALCKLLDVTIVYRQPNATASSVGQGGRILPFAGTTLHGHTTELTDNPKSTTVGACFHARFRACITANLRKHAVRLSKTNVASGGKQ